MISANTHNYGGAPELERIGEIGVDIFGTYPECLCVGTGGFVFLPFFLKKTNTFHQLIFLSALS